MSFGCGFCCYGYTVTVVWDHSLPFYDNGLFLDSMFTRAFGLVWFSVQISVAVVIILFVRLDVFFLSSSSSPSSPPRKYILCDLCVYMCFYWSPSQLVAYQLVPQFSAVQIQGPNLAPPVLSSWNASGIHLCTGR